VVRRDGKKLNHVPPSSNLESILNIIVYKYYYSYFNVRLPLQEKGVHGEKPREGKGGIKYEEQNTKN
jgi:hypothetical protein